MPVIFDEIISIKLLPPLTDKSLMEEDRTTEHSALNLIGSSMKRLIKFGGIGAGVVGFVLACSSANFGGGASSGTSGDANESGTPGAASAGPGSGAPGSPASSASAAPGGPAQCSEDKVNLGFANEEKACIVDNGQTWNFDKKQCMQIRKASFDCTWANVLAALDAHAIGTPLIKADAAAGGKLISCGQSQDGNRIVAQWISVQDGANSVPCSGGASSSYHVTTGCYTYYPNGGAPAPATTAAAKDAQVFGCLNAL